MEAGNATAIMELLDSDIEWCPAAPEVHRGIDEVAAFMRQWADSFEDYRWEPEEFIDAGDAVVVVTREHGRGRVSGVEIKGRFAAVWTIRDRRITRFQEYSEKHEALEAVGLRE